MSEQLSTFTEMNWIGFSSVLRPRQHSIGYMGDGFYRSTVQYQSTEGTNTLCLKKTAQL